MKESKDILIIVLLMAVVVGVASFCNKPPPREIRIPLPDKPILPIPAPDPPKPAPRPKPWDPITGSTVVERQRGGLTSPDGKEEMQCPLPASEKKRNIGGSDGAGLCVFTSMEYCGRYQNVRKMFDYQKWASKRPGGSYPSKTDHDMKEFAPEVRYLSSTTGDVALLKKALASNRMVAVCTMGGAHMVTLCHLTDKWACETDNNAPGDDQYIWFTPAEFEKDWKAASGWCVILLGPGPTPPPKGPNAPRSSWEDGLASERPWGRDRSPRPYKTQRFDRSSGLALDSASDRLFRPFTKGEGQMKALALVAALGMPANIYVDLPQEATLTINGAQTVSTGPSRLFTTPALEEGRTFNYDLEMTIGDQKCVQEVAVRAGEDTHVALRMPAVAQGDFYGVDKEKIHKGDTTLNGVPITRRQAMLLIEDSLPEDHQSPYITVIGQAADCKPVLDDLANSPELAAFKGRWRVQDYTPDQWPLQGVNFVTSGKPTIYLQKADGTVLHRQDAYNGPQMLALALRKADPSYDPKKDPDLTKPALIPDVLGVVPPVAWGGLAVIGGLLVLGRRKT